jgi:hypothetical protein
MDMDDGLAAGEVEQRVALAHRLAEPGADGEDQVRLPRLRTSPASAPTPRSPA